jgi:pimeloyl-ACP methyl ester carboxylesterase
MIHEITTGQHVKYPVHTEYADPSFEDSYHDVRLDSHFPTDHDGADIDLSFKCRVRRWKLSEDNDKPSIFVIPGIVHSCNFFNPMVKCMSIDEEFKAGVSSVFAFDLPGHGASGSPPNIKFGMLRLADYVSVILQVMDIVKAEFGSIDCVVAHSMGGLLAMLTERSLNSPTGAAGAETLNSKYGTTSVALLASAMPEQIRWSFGEGRVSRFGVPVTMLSMLLPFVTVSPTYLAHGRLSNDDFLKTFFAVYSEHSPFVEVVPGAPVGDTVSIINSAESYSALAELGGLDIDLKAHGTAKRPFIKEGLFSAYKFGVAGYTKDILFRPEEEEELCGYLSKTEARKIYRTIDHDYAVHDDPYTYPCASFQLVKDVMNLPDS